MIAPPPPPQLTQRMPSDPKLARTTGKNENERGPRVSPVAEQERVVDGTSLDNVPREAPLQGL